MSQVNVNAVWFNSLSAQANPYGTTGQAALVLYTPKEWFYSINYLATENSNYITTILANGDQSMATLSQSSTTLSNPAWYPPTSLSAVDACQQLGASPCSFSIGASGGGYGVLNYNVSIFEPTMMTSP